MTNVRGRGRRETRREERAPKSAGARSAGGRAAGGKGVSAGAAGASGGVFPGARFVSRHPDLVACLFLAVTLIACFHPLFFEGKVFLPPDLVASKSHRPFVDASLAAGEYPQWTPCIFGGMPSFASLAAAPYTSPFSIAINGVIRALDFLLPLPMQAKEVSYFLLLGIGTYFLLRKRKVDPVASVFAALTFMYATHVLTMIVFGHTSKLATLISLPALLLATDRMLDRWTATRVALAGLVAGILLVSSHIQIAFYALLATAFYTAVALVAALVRDRRPLPAVLRDGASVALAVVLGLAMSAVIALPVREYAEFSIRGGSAGGGLDYNYATSWSLHPREALTFLVPSLFGYGGASYWGWMPFNDFPMYVGILPLFLATIALVSRRDRFTWFFAGLAVFSMLVSFGRFLPVIYGPMFEHLPFFNKFRVPNMILVLFHLSAGVLAALGIQELLEGRPGRRAFTRTAVAWILVMGGFAFVFGLGGSGLETSYRTAALRGHPNLTPALALEGFEASKADAARNFVILLAGIGAVLLWRRRSLPKAAFGGALLVFLLFDLWTVGSKSTVYQEPADQTRIFEEPDFVTFLKADTTHFRILPVPQNPPPNWYAYFLLQNMSGYHPAKLTVYQNLMDEAGGLGNPVLWSLFGTKYLVLDREVSHPDLEPAFRGRYLVYRYTRALPRAWFAPRVTVLASEDSVLARLKDPAFRPAEEVLLSQAPPSPVDPAGAADTLRTPVWPDGAAAAGAGAPGTDARVARFSFHDVEVEARTDRQRLLFVSEMFYPPGWTATLDGAEVPILQANHAFRAVVVPPGEHRVRFRYHSKSFERGILISAVAYGLVLLALLGGLARRLLRKAEAGA